MKLRVSQQTSRALTLIELLVVIAVLVVLFLVINNAAYANGKAKQTAQRLHCVNNLKQVGLAYHIWADNNNGKYPTEVSIINGGTLELMTTADAWRTYQVMSNELSTPKILFCPADDDRWPWATNFSNDLKGKISYFIGLDASTNLPLTFLSGDDNLAIAGQPVKPGWISLTSNTPVAWTKARHNLIGNIGIADGSVQVLTRSTLPSQLQQTGLPTNRLVIP